MQGYMQASHFAPKHPLIWRETHGQEELEKYITYIWTSYHVKALNQ